MDKGTSPNNINQAEHNMLPDIMSYESKIWAIADLLIASGIKQSDFPKYMMPYFALMMAEGRLRAVVADIEENDVKREEDKEEFIEEFRSRDCGYNKYVVEQDKTLSDICANDKTFHQDYSQYLAGFDNEMKMLLGISRGQEEKYLNIDGINAELDKKGILLSVVKDWSEIDLAGYSNSDITTLEEHIKRKWADISAETAGEQYTPDDIISLISEIIADKIDKPQNEYVNVYDPTCGGGNLLFGVADRLHSAGYKHITTSGCDFNDQLYALAKIESKFRNDADIRYGNTLTTVPFSDKSFDVVVANPPYGVKWSGYQKDIKNDQTGQFKYLPSIQDGQLLFMQHILYQLADNGLAVEVHNGSTLFSGDAGGAESNIRKYMMDMDWVEAIVQMPTDEFFNTGIYTYLWVMNKSKRNLKERRDQMLLIDASRGWRQLKKSKGSKRREMDEENRKNIVEALHRYEDCEIGNIRAKKFPKWHFYYNKQKLKLINVSEDGETVLHTMYTTSHSRGSMSTVARELTPKTIVYDGELVYDDKKKPTGEDFSMLVADLTKAEPEKLVITTIDGTYSFGKDERTFLFADKEGQTRKLGFGKLTFKQKTTKKEGKYLRFYLEADYQTDYEIIGYHPNPEKNKQGIDDFIKKYVTKPEGSYREEPTVGVEISFNKEFYEPEVLESVASISADINELNKSLFDLQKGLAL